jgi:hypothetical protein
MTRREMQQAARRLAQQQTAQAADTPTGSFITNVATTSPLTINWNLSTVPAWKLASYTPVAGDRVQVEVISNQVIIQGRIN